MRNAKELLEKYKVGACSEEELAILHKWIHEKQKDLPTALDDDDLFHAEDLLRNRFQQITSNTKIKKIFITTGAAAAILLAALFIYLQQKKTIPPTQITASAIQDVSPGGQVATLTLGDGQKIALAEIPTGETINKSGNNIIKNENGELIYSSLEKESPIEYHLIETPLKGMHKIVLHDGSKIWLNSLSSLRFPNKFTNNKREVELDGEAYFEIEKDSKKPFYVISKGQKITVLGTQFNVKSYADESQTKTTLVEGAVKVVSSDNNTTFNLSPGEQSILHQGKINISKVNVNHVIDWKNGDFIFNGETLPQIMKRVSRWYGVQVLYEKGIDKTQTFSGQVSRSKNLSEIIVALSATSDLYFKIQDNKIIIKNKA